MMWDFISVVAVLGWVVFGVQKLLKFINRRPK